MRLRNSPSPLKPIYSDGAQRTYRIDREAGLQVRTNKRKQVVRPPSPGAGSRHSQCALVDGLRRGPLANELGQRPRPLPKTTVGDNGLAFTSKARYCWAKRSAVKLYFIQPGKPAQNACVERFNGKFREYCFNLNGFASIEDARATTDTLTDALQLHSDYIGQLGNKPPAVFAKQAV